MAPEEPGERLVEGQPCIAAEVVWAARREMAVGAEDVLARRMRLAFLDSDAARRAGPRVQNLLSDSG